MRFPLREDDTSSCREHAVALMEDSGEEAADGVLPQISQYVCACMCFLFKVTSFLGRGQDDIICSLLLMDEAFLHNDRENRSLLMSAR